MHNEVDGSEKENDAGKRKVSYAPVRNLIGPSKESVLALFPNDKKNLQKRWSDLKAIEGTANPAMHWLLCLAEHQDKPVDELVAECWSDEQDRKAALHAASEIQENKKSSKMSEPNSESAQTTITNDFSRIANNEELHSAETRCPPRTTMKFWAIPLTTFVFGVAISGLLFLASSYSSKASRRNDIPSPKAMSLSGYHADFYHPTAPVKMKLDVHPPREILHGKNPHGVLRYEAAPGTYQLLVVNDRRGLLAGRDNVILFYKNGDEGQFDSDTQTNRSKYDQIVRFGEPRTFEFTVDEGTTKVSCMLAAEGDSLDEIPNTHTVCIFYSYPDLTFEDAKVTPLEGSANEVVTVHVTVANRGIVPSQPGKVSILLQPANPVVKSIEAGIQEYRALEPGENQSLAISFALPNLPPGILQGKLVIDSENTTGERDELFAGKWKENLGQPFRPKLADPKVVSPNNFGTFEVMLK